MDRLYPRCRWRIFESAFIGYLTFYSEKHGRVYHHS
jgi:sugar phosphate permease